MVKLLRAILSHRNVARTASPRIAHPHANLLTSAFEFVSGLLLAVIRDADEGLMTRIGAVHWII